MKFFFTRKEGSIKILRLKFVHVHKCLRTRVYVVYSANETSINETSFTSANLHWCA